MLARIAEQGRVLFIFGPFSFLGWVRHVLVCLVRDTTAQNKQLTKSDKVSVITMPSSSSCRGNGARAHELTAVLHIPVNRIMKFAYRQKCIHTIAYFL